MQGSVKANLLMLGLTLVICLGLLELALRYVLPEDMGTTRDLRIPHLVFSWAHDW